VSSGGELPVGTATFLFTDIEGSTRLERELRERYGEVLGDHRRLLREAFEHHGGREIDTQGDSFFFVFPRARDAVAAAVAGQRALAENEWPRGHEVRVRIGMHTGEATLDEGRYVGLAVHRGARISASGHGGQILLSSSTRDVVEDDLPGDQRLVDLGEHRLKDLPRPERIFQLVAEGLPDRFPPLKTMGSAPFEGRESELAEAAVQELARARLRPGRRGFIAATAAAAAVGVAVGLLAARGGGSEASAAVSGNAVGVFDSDGDIVSEIEVGDTPSEVAATRDAVWVTNTTDNTVSRIDPATNDVRQTIAVGAGPTGVAGGGGDVWVANGLEATVSRVDPSTNREVQKVAVGNGPTGIAFGEGAVWVTNSVDGTVSRVAPGPGTVTGTFPAVVGVSAVTVGFGRVWVASPSTASVLALHPRTGDVLARIGVGVEPDAIAVGVDAVWVANRADGTVSKIDPEVAAVTSTVQVGRRPDGIAAGPNTVWVANSRDGTLSHIDTETDRVRGTVALVNPPRGLAFSNSRLYVAVRSTGVEHRGGELRVLADEEPDSIDPALAYNPTSWSILIMTNDGLVAFRKVAGVEGTQLVPDLAVALPSPTDGGRTYTFELRRNFTYSNGELVRPEDFRRAIERVFELGSPSVPIYAGIVGASGCRRGTPCNLARGIATDRAARTVTFRLTTPDADFLSKLALPFAFAVPSDTGTREVTRPLPATGPYRVASYERRARTLRLVRNGRFREWSPDAQPNGFPDSIRISWGREFSDTVKVVGGGASDVALSYGLPLTKQRLEELALRYPRRLKVTPQLTTGFYFLNTRVPPFADARARRAVSLAWDREEVERAIGRTGTPTCRILPPNFPGYRPTCPGGVGGLLALDRARKLVRESGTQGARVLVWTFADVPPDLGRYVVSLLNSLGYRARLQVVRDIGAYFMRVSNVRTGVQIGFAGWFQDYPSAEGFIRPLLSCAAYDPTSPETTTNYSGFCDRSVDAQMARATATQVTDPAAGIQLWQRVEEALLAQAPIVPAFNFNYVSLVSARVGNYQLNPQWGILLSQLWVK
jgi:YVTN family beta-propeller protein